MTALKSGMTPIFGQVRRPRSRIRETGRRNIGVTRPVILENESFSFDCGDDEW
jgi:hypothetical protein